MKQPQVTCRVWVLLLKRTTDTPVPEGKASTDQEADCPLGGAWTHGEPPAPGITEEHHHPPCCGDSETQNRRRCPRTGPKGQQSPTRATAPGRPCSPGQAPEVHLAADVGAWTQDHPQPHLLRQQDEGPRGLGSPTLRARSTRAPRPAPPPLASPALLGGLGTLRSGHAPCRAETPPRVTAKPPAWDIGVAALGHEQKEVPHLGHKVLTEGLTRVTQPSGDHPASRARGDGRGAGLGVGQACPRGGGIMMEGVGPAQAPPAAPSAPWDAPWVPAPQTPPAPPGRVTEPTPGPGSRRSRMCLSPAHGGSTGRSCGREEGSTNSMLLFLSSKLPGRSQALRELYCGKS